MKTCPVCNEQMKSSLDFCTSCGASLKTSRSDRNKQDNQTVQQQPTKKRKPFILLTLLIALLVTLFTSYQLLSKKYSEETVEEQFKTALLEKDKKSLTELIQPDDSRIHINDDSLNALLALIDNEPSIVDEMTEQLGNVGYNNSGLFSVKKDGKHYGIFDRYVIDTQGYFLLLSSTSSEETIFYLNDKEVGTLEQGEESKEIGPLLTGSYLVKATTNKDDEQEEDMTNIKLAGTETKVEVVLDTEIMEEVEEEEEQEMFFWIEDDYDYYILPDSDSIYLDEADVYYLTSAELRIARNEIFARHGYIFESKELQNYFSSLNWYYPDVNYDGYLSDVEKHNIDLIKSME